MLSYLCTCYSKSFRDTPLETKLRKILISYVNILKSYPYIKPKCAQGKCQRNVLNLQKSLKVIAKYHKNHACFTKSKLFKL